MYGELCKAKLVESKVGEKRKVGKVISDKLFYAETKGVWHIDEVILNTFKDRGTLEVLDERKRLVFENKSVYEHSYCFVITVDISNFIGDANDSKGLVFKTKGSYLDFINRLNRRKARVIYAKYLF